ncbi:kinase-like domain-containing protein [Xylariaceae sp. FL0255]|nr:kinase-like domain-containing protein [Xylariaceae sp. FL0255]
MPIQPAEKRQVDCRTFKEWVKSYSKTGVNGKGEEKDYIPKAKLKEYMDRNVVLNLLSQNDKHLDIGRIISSFIQVFSILVWISTPECPRTDYIRFFFEVDWNDLRLPLPPPPRPGERHPYHQSHFPFPDDPEGLPVWQQFCEHQWRFLPVLFLDSTNTRIEKTSNWARPGLDPGVDINQIRPITIRKELPQQGVGAAKLFIVMPHEASGLPEDPIVLKEYPIVEYDGQFKHEHEAYTTISNNAFDSEDRLLAHSLGYHGAFLQGDKCVLLLEYASEGTLLDLFTRSWHLPRYVGEAHSLWEAAFDMLESVGFLHNMDGNNCVVHQDIKPANLFVFKDPQATHKLLLKFGDFGMSSTAEPSWTGEATGPDNQGSRMYSAPEICSWTEGDQEMPRKINSKCDIWAIGAVFFELAVWMAMFERGRIEFRDARVEAMKRSSRVANAGYRGAFHDGKSVLTVVASKVDEVRNVGTPVALLSARVMSVVLRYMLVPAERKRLPARELIPYLLDALDPPTSTPSVTVGNPSPTVLTTQDVTLQPPPQLTASPSTISNPNTNSRHELPITPSRTSDFELPGPSYIHSSPPARLMSKREDADMFPQATGSYATGGTARSYLPYRPRDSDASPPAFGISSTGDHSILPPATLQRTPKHLHSNYPFCSVEDVRNWTNRPKKLRSQLAGMDRALKDLKDRDQCFIFDNSWSMMEHWAEVKRTAFALASIVQSVDPDGFELGCTNTGSHKIIDRSKEIDQFLDKGRREIEHFLRDNQPHRDIGSCRMEYHLNNTLPTLVQKATAERSLLAKVRRVKQIKGINVYVFTNGVWENANEDTGNERGGAVQHAIKSIIKTLKEQDRPRTFLSIQFIRFGESEVGSKRLQWLDDDLKFEIPDEWDIVDTTPHNGNVWKMIIGATSAYEDNVQDEAPQAFSPLSVQRAATFASG